MFLLRHPSPSFLGHFLEAQGKLDLTYSPTGATAAPPGYGVDHTRTLLGSGPAAFIAAKTALQRWEPFRLGWVEPCRPDAPIEAGQVVGVLARFGRFYFLNACRILYVVDEPTRFGFAYGTLPAHMESGEERFTVEWNADDGVWYDLLAFSRPHHLLARLGYPLARRLQKRFAKDSAEAMKRAIKST